MRRLMKQVLCAVIGPARDYQDYAAYMMSRYMLRVMSAQDALAPATC
jgi:hypothetical protein